MFPPGFLGTSADLLMDIVVVAFAVIVPTLIYSWIKARRGKWKQHKRVQLILASVLAVAVILFEVDMKQNGGIFEMTKASPYAGTGFYIASVYFHTAVAILTSLLWVVLIALSLFKFDREPRPNSFSRTHRILGRFAMILMGLTGITGIQIYAMGFVGT